MPSVRLSPLAENDLEDIWLYTSRHWSVIQADKYIADLVTTFGKLETGELVGRSEAIRERYMKCPVGSHVVFYRASDTWIDIIRVLHNRMNFEDHI